MLRSLRPTIRVLRQPHNTFRVCVLLLSLAFLILTASASESASASADRHHQRQRGSDDYDDEYGDDLDDYMYDDYGVKKKPSTGGSAGAPAETSAFNFVRLLVLRLVWGFASMFGFQEGLEDFMGGIFVPPGVEAEDDFDFF